MRNRLHIYIDIFNLPSIGQRKFAIVTINPTGIDKRRIMYVNREIGRASCREREEMEAAAEAEDGIRDFHVTGVQTCALPISKSNLKYHCCWPLKQLAKQDGCAIDCIFTSIFLICQA